MNQIIPTKLQPNLANLSENLWLPFYMRQNGIYNELKTKYNQDVNDSLVKSQKVKTLSQLA